VASSGAGATTITLTIDPARICPKHGKPFEFFDADSEQLICSICAIFGDSKNHENLPLDVALNRVLPGLRDDTLRQEAQLRRYESRLSLARRLDAAAAHAETDAIADVTAHFRVLRDALDKRETDLKAEIERKVQERRELIGLMAERLTRSVTEATTALDQRRAVLAHADPFEVLMNRSGCSELVSRLEAALPSLEPPMDVVPTVALPQIALRLVVSHGAVALADAPAYTGPPPRLADLPPAGFEAASLVLEQRKTGLGQISSLLTAHVTASSDARRAANAVLSRAVLPEESGPIGQAWRAVQEDAVLVSSLAGDYATVIASGPVRELSAHKDALAAQRAEVVASADATRRELSRHMHLSSRAQQTAERCLAEVRAAWHALQRAQRAGSGLRRAEAKLRKAREAYAVSREAYVTAVSAFNSARHQLTGDMGEKFLRLETLETARVAFLKGLARAVVSAREDALLRQIRALQALSGHVAAISPQKKVASIFEFAQSHPSTSATDAGFSVDFPELPEDPAGDLSAEAKAEADVKRRSRRLSDEAHQRALASLPGPGRSSLGRVSDAATGETAESDGGSGAGTSSSAGGQPASSVTSASLSVDGVAPEETSGAGPVDRLHSQEVEAGSEPSASDEEPQSEEPQSSPLGATAAAVVTVDVDIAATATAASADILPPSTDDLEMIPGTPRRAIAAFDYQALAVDEHSLVAGAVVLVKAHDAEGWSCVATLEAPSDFRLVPGSYLRFEDAEGPPAEALVLSLSESLPADAREPQATPADFSPVDAVADATPATSPMYFATALYDFPGADADDLPLIDGETYAVLEDDAGWCTGYHVADPGTRGMFPSDYVQRQ
jgi:hypothetical protein